MPFYGNEFLQAIEGQSDSVAMGYLRAVWFYWHHTHCKGLKDDGEFLRKVCRIEKDEWPSAREVLFDNNHFFTQDTNDLWQQKRASQIWEQMKVRYESKIKQTAAARSARWKGKR
jgi:uncharacterized protein YdaU (DUF1376 family)